MPLINTSLPNLVQGVSQQPATLRFDGQCEEQINALSSVSDGLKKRPNTRYIKNLIDSELDDGAFVHYINRDKNEKYVLIIENTSNTSPEKTTIKVYNILDTNPSPVFSTEITATNNYLFVPKTGSNAAKPKDVLKALTVGDTTFILNTSKSVSRIGSTYKSPAITSSSTTNKALVFIKKGDYSTEYNIKIKARYYTSGTLNNGVTATQVTSSGQIGYELALNGNALNESTHFASGTLSSSKHEFNASFKTNDQSSGETTQGISTGIIAKSLRDSIARALRSFGARTQSSGGFLYDYDGFKNTHLTVGEVTAVSAQAEGDYNAKHTSATDFSLAADTTKSNYQQYVFEISSSDNVEFEISAFDSKSGSALGVVYKEVDSISDLPTIAPNNFKVKVRGSAEDNEDDFYVKFETDSGASAISNGGWIEDVGFDEHIILDSGTLPYKLVNTGVSTFSFSASTWNTKQVGDSETNPFPSFFNGTGDAGDRKISNIFFYKNRLGLLSEGSVIMSEAGEYFNFFRTTVRSLLDSDPIDINVASKRVTNLSSAVGFQENLVLFGERGQFVLKGGDLLTPKTVSVTPITNYENDTSTTPLELGSYLYFPFTRGNFTGIREFSVNASTDNYDSGEVTSHVPQYIPSNVLDIAGSTTENLICLVSNKTADETKNMYVYKYYWEGNQKVLSSWSKFTFPFKIRGIEFVDSDLYIVAAKNGKTILLKMPMEEKLVDDNTTFNTYLDMRTNDTYTTGNQGEIVLPFTPDTDDVIQVYTREHGSTKAGALLPSTRNGNVVSVGSDKINIPVWLGIKYEMSYTFSEQLFKQRANKNTSPSGYQRHVLKGGTIFFDDSSSFKVEVTPKARQTYTNTFTSNIVGSTTIGTLPIESGSFSFPIMSSAKDTTIKLVNDSALPANFQSAEFESFIHSRSRRV
tara:strand:- start:507 stop:3272 length:2766 start_codon:yes stop_codon:yes gene_type:complete